MIALSRHIQLHTTQLLSVLTSCASFFVHTLMSVRHSPTSASGEHCSHICLHPFLLFCATRYIHEHTRTQTKAPTFFRHFICFTGLQRFKCLDFLGGITFYKMLVVSKKSPTVNTLLYTHTVLLGISEQMYYRSVRLLISQRYSVNRTHKKLIFLQK